MSFNPLHVDVSNEIWCVSTNKCGRGGVAVLNPASILTAVMVFMLPTSCFEKKVHTLEQRHGALSTLGRSYLDADELCLGCSVWVVYSGMHYPESRFYVRRVRVSSDADVLGPLRDAGYRFGPTSWLPPPHWFARYRGLPSLILQQPRSMPHVQFPL